MLLFELVKKFCDALLVELESAEYLESELCSFPGGSCEITSQMLALYLESEGIENVVYTRNETDVLEVGSVHYWVVVDNIIVDLTAHQFTEFEGDCILPIESPFHAQFKQLATSSPSIASLDRPFSGQGNLLFYNKLMSRLENA